MSSGVTPVTYAVVELWPSGATPVAIPVMHAGRSATQTVLRLPIIADCDQILVVISTNPHRNSHRNPHRDDGMFRQTFAFLLHTSDCET